MLLTDLRVFTEPQQGASYDDLLAVAQRAEQLGFGAFFRSDHYLKMSSVSGLPGPTDAWITLAGLARDTSTIRLGTLVSSATFRHPGPLAIAVAGVDQMSGGRIELGLGAGWFDDEHQAYGIPFAPLKQRFDDLTEQLEVITGLWSTPLGETFDHAGPRWPISNSPALPKPVQAGGVPIIVGGHGTKRTPQLAARYATEFNLAFGGLDEFVAQRGHVTAACESIGRDPGTLTWSAALIVVAGTHEAEVQRRAAAVGREPDELRQNGVAGTPDECAETLRRWAAAGAERIYLQVLDLADLDHLDLVAEAIAPQL